MHYLRLLLLATVLMLLMAAPAFAQPSDDEVTACRVIAGQVESGAAQPPDTLPHPDQSLADCDGDGIQDTSDPEVDADDADPSDVQVTTGGDGTGNTAPPVVAADPNPGSQDLGLAGDRGLIIAGGGLESMMAPPPFRGSNAPTVLEAIGYDALRLRDSNGGALDTITNPTQSINQGIAEMLIVFAHIITATATSLLQWAFSPDLLSPVYDQIQNIVDRLRPLIFDGWTSVAIVAGITWVGYRTVSRRMAEGLGGLVWMLAALAIAIWFFAAPGSYLRTATEWTAGLSGQVLSAMSIIEPDTTGTASVPDTATYRSRSEEGGYVPRGALDVPRTYEQVLRRSSDRIYRTLAYQPWAVMQLGSQEAADRWGYAYLEASTITMDEVAAVRAGNLDMDDLTEQRAEQLENLEEDIEDQDPVAYEWLQGDHSGSQLALSSLLFVAAVSAGLVLITVAGTLLFLQLLAILLVAVSPVIGVIAIYPGPMGRNLAVRYLQTLIGTFFQRVTIAILLGVMVLVYGLLLSSSATIGWFPTIIAVILTGAAILSFRQQLTYMVTGGLGGNDADQAGSRAVGRVQSTGRSAIGLATTAIAVRGAGRRGARAAARNHALQSTDSDFAGDGQSDSQGERADRSPSGSTGLLQRGNGGSRRSSLQNRRNRRSQQRESLQPFDWHTPSNATPSSNVSGSNGSASPTGSPVSNGAPSSNGSSRADQDRQPRASNRHPEPWSNVGGHLEYNTANAAGLAFNWPPSSDLAGDRSGYWTRTPSGRAWSDASEAEQLNGTMHPSAPAYGPPRPGTVPTPPPHTDLSDSTPASDSTPRRQRASRRRRIPLNSSTSLPTPPSGRRIAPPVAPPQPVSGQPRWQPSVAAGDAAPTDWAPPQPREGPLPSASPPIRFDHHDAIGDV